MRSAPAITERFSQFIADLAYDDLPESTVETVKLLFFDYLRVSSLGSQRQSAKKIYRLMNRLGGKGKSSILVHQGFMDPSRAALINAAFASELDWDDTHVGAMLHPGVIIFSSAIAVAEQVKSNGKRFITAVAAAYDAMIRIALSVQPSHFNRGFHSQATCGVFGAAIAASKLMGMKIDEIISTLGIAASYASGLTQFYRYGSQIKRIHSGKSAEAGIMAALFVDSGIDGPPHILEGEFGFCNAYSDTNHPEVIIEKLGDEFKILEITLKANACSARLQASLEAIFYILKQYDFSLSEINEIVIGIPNVIAGRLTHHKPPDIVSAQLSLPFSVALALYLGKNTEEKNYLSTEDYEMNISNKEVLYLASKIICRVDEDVDKKTSLLHVPSKVRIKLEDGKEIYHTIDIPKGSPTNPFTIDEIKERFSEQTGKIIQKDDRNSVMSNIEALQELSNISAITRQMKRR